MISIKNGVRQGKVLAGFAYCLYCRDLFDILEKSWFGLRIKGVYAGVVGFSDEDLLLAPSFTALQEMIKLTDEYCTEHGLSFSSDVNPEK